ncbi:hypothetical protein [Pseudomonas sp. A-RE-19]|uniref:hypothetical protein n=1 Tax=Pseudomonas sp. A-RE-19 TaxID=2832401 RepID=UPI001CBCB6C4|nr:hypothetical protein [Pseudomonas sp. A-RE-19]
MRTFDLIRDAVLPEFRDRVAEYLVQYETELRGYLRGLNTTRVLGMADWEELDRRITESWL